MGQKQRVALGWPGTHHHKANRNIGEEFRGICEDDGRLSEMWHPTFLARSQEHRSLGLYVPEFFQERPYSEHAKGGQCWGREQVR
jgi:hypothetical protein